MLAVIDNLYDEIESCRKDGIKIGRKETLQQIVKNMLKKVYPIETISEMTGLKIEEVKKIAKEIKWRYSIIICYTNVGVLFINNITMQWIIKNL